MNKEQRKFKKNMKARKHRKGRIFQYQQNKLIEKSEIEEQRARSKKFYEERAKLKREVKTAEGRLLTDEEALGKVSKVKKLLKAHGKKRSKNEEKSNA